MSEVWVRRCECECFLCSEGIGHCDIAPECDEEQINDPTTAPAPLQYAAALAVAAVCGAVIAVAMALRGER